jgi:predicted DNA-binding transcriptional regulator AlpA
MTANQATTERWLTKRQIAEHFGFTTRWVELRMREGLPSIRLGNRRRFRLSEVEAWLVSQG